MESKDIIAKIKEQAYENVNKKLQEEREKTETKIKGELDVVKRCVEFIENHLVFKKIDGTYVLATSDMFFEDYSKDCKYNFDKGVKVKENRRTYEPWFKVNGESYYELRYIIGKYEDDFRRFSQKVDRLYEAKRNLEEELNDMISKQKTVKRLLEQYSELTEKEGYSFGDMW